MASGAVPSKQPRSPDYTQDLAGIRAPVLLIHGRYDRMVPFEVSIAILNHIAAAYGALLYPLPASKSRCSANSALTQSMTARTHAARRRSRWTMIQYSAAISGIGGVSRSISGWPSPT
jgi:pimeloyl-ACP methyl ester carboxylesterase